MRRLEAAGLMPEDLLAGTKSWFYRYVNWLTDDPKGIKEMRTGNNHGVCWILQVGNFARYVGWTEWFLFCKNRFKYKYLPDSVAHKLMVRCYKKDMSVKRCWLKGMILASIDDTFKAVVRMNDDEKTLAIDVYAKNGVDAKPYVLFKPIRDQVLEINGKLGLTAKEFIKSGEDTFSVKALLNSYEKNIQELRDFVFSRQGQCVLYFHLNTNQGPYIVKANSQARVPCDQEFLKQLELMNQVQEVWTA